MRSFVVCAVTCILCAGVSPVFASPTLDQHQEAVDNPTPLYIAYKYAQTFTAGLSGVLDHIEMSVLSNPLPAAVNVSITDVAAGAPGPNILGSGSIASGTPPGWTSVDFLSQDIPMSAGTMYAIVLSPTSSTTVRFNGTTYDLYSGGQYEMLIGSTWYPNSADFTFRTYVETDVVPVPGAVLLGAIGASCSACWLRGRGGKRARCER